MARLKGKNGRVKYGATSELIGKIQSFNIDTSAEVVESWGMGETFTESFATVTSWSGSVEVDLDPADPSATIAVGDVEDFEFYPDGDATGDLIYSGTAYVTGVALSFAKDAFGKATINLKGTGPLVQGTV